MKLLASVATLATLAAAAPSVAPSPEVSVKLEMQENSKVKAIVTNPTKDSIKILKTGSILDSTPVQKVSVSNSGKATYKFAQNPTHRIQIANAMYM